MIFYTILVLAVMSFSLLAVYKVRKDTVKPSKEVLPETKVELQIRKDAQLIQKKAANIQKILDNFSIEVK